MESSSSCQTGMVGHPVTSVSGSPDPPPPGQLHWAQVGQREEAGNTQGLVCALGAKSPPPQVPRHLLVGPRLHTTSNRATAWQSTPRSMLSSRGSACGALSGVQGQGCGRVRGPAWALAGTQGQQAAGATASLLQPSEVAAKGSGEAGTGA